MSNVSGTGITVIVIASLAILIMLAARVAVIKRARKEARAIEARRAGLPFPIGTSMSTNERRWSQAAALDARALHVPQARPVTLRQTSQNDVGLPSYTDPGIKVPEAMYNPTTAGSITPYPQPPAPTGAPPGYSITSPPPPVRA